MLISVFIAGLAALGGIVPALLPAPERTALQSTASLERRLTTRIDVTVPADDAELVVNGERDRGRGGVQSVRNGSPLDAGIHRYTFTVTWKPNTYTTMTRSKTVAFRGGRDGAGRSHG